MINKSGVKKIANTWFNLTSASPRKLTKCWKDSNELEKTKIQGNNSENRKKKNWEINSE